MVKSNGLLGILTMSEYRKDILFLLQERPWTLSEIKERYEVISPEILPRLKQMEKSGIIIKENQTYYLTPFGKVLTKHFKPLLDVIQAMEVNKEFWDQHDISTIPDTLLEKMGDLKGCTVSKLKSSQIVGSHEEFIANVKNAGSFKGATSVLNPSWVKLFAELSQFNVPIEITVTKDVYEDIVKDYSYELKEGLRIPFAHMYVSEVPFNIGLSAVCGPGWQFFSMALNNKSGQYDTQNDLQGCDIESYKWGKELLEYYQANAEEVPREQEVNELVFPVENATSRYKLYKSCN